MLDCTLQRPFLTHLGDRTYLLSGRDFDRKQVVAYLSLDGLYRALGQARRDPDIPQYCDACFSGDYPIRLVDRDVGESDGQLSLLIQVP